MSLCQRYYEKSFPQGTAPAYSGAYQWTVGTAYLSTAISIASIQFKVTKRASPTLVTYGLTTSGWRYYAAGWKFTTSMVGAANESGFSAESGGGVSVLAQYDSCLIGGNWTAEIEL